MQLQELLQVIEAKTGKRCHQSGNGYQACCPAHNDSTTSLSISEKADGKILMHCFAGCDIKAICKILGIDLKDLFNDNHQIEFQKIQPVFTYYPYHNELGKVIYRKVRVEPGPNGKKKGFHFERPSENGRSWIKNMNGIKRVLYHLPEVIEAKTKGENIYLTEGEKDSERLSKGGLVATTPPEGAEGEWRSQYTETLSGAHVVLLFDEDAPGYVRRDKVIKALYGKAASLKVVKLPGLIFDQKGKCDVSDWLNLGHTISELKDLVINTPVYEPSLDIEIGSEIPAIVESKQLIVPGGIQTIQETGQKAAVLLRETGLYFSRGGALMKIVKDRQGDPYLEPIKPVQLASEIELVAQVVKRGKNSLAPTILSVTQAQSIMESRMFREEIPEIVLLSKSPVLALNNDRTLRIITNYDREKGILSFANTPQQVSLNDAVKLLLELISDFKFATDADRSRAVAAFITPALIYGQLIRGRAPLFTVEADDSQTGKGFLVKSVAACYNAKPCPITQRRTGVGGLEESLNSRLIRGDSFISLDNIRGKIDSPALESLLTEDSYLARIPYLSAVEIDPKRIILFLTSNQCEMTRDLANRTCSIQLRKREMEYKFKSYHEGDLIEHILINQKKYFGAIVAIVKEWVSLGCPHSNERKHDFHHWSRALDWIIQNIMNLPPLMNGHRETQNRLISRQTTWLRALSFVVLSNQMQSDWITTRQILDLIAEAELSIPGLSETEDLSEEKVRARVLKAMGKELGLNFKMAQPVQIDNQHVDEVTIDDIKVQRRISKFGRGNDSGPIDVKEYRFLRVDTINISTYSPPTAIVATDSKTTSHNCYEKDLPSTSFNLSSCGIINGINGGSMADQWRKKSNRCIVLLSSPEFTSTRFARTSIICPTINRN